MVPAIAVLVTDRPLDEPASSHAPNPIDPRVGAVVTFAGLCRDEGGRLAALELEHYPGMAEAELRAIAAETAGRFSLTRVSIAHRHGVIRPGETIVLVTTAGAHRAETFAGAEFLMDYLKDRAPFWKKERPRDGGSGRWAEAKETDAAALARWTAAASDDGENR